MRPITTRLVPVSVPYRDASEGYATPPRSIGVMFGLILVKLNKVFAFGIAKCRIVPTFVQYADWSNHSGDTFRRRMQVGKGQDRRNRKWRIGYLRGLAAVW